MNPLLVAILVTCYNGPDVVYKGTDIIFVETRIEALSEDNTFTGTIKSPYEYISHCTIGTGFGTRYECTSCDIQNQLTKGETSESK